MQETRWRRVRRWLSRSTLERRLEVEVPSFGSYLDQSSEKDTSQWNKAKAALDAASAALEQRNFAGALIAFDRAKREEILGLKSPDEIQVRVISLKHQLPQLSSGARNAITEIMQKTRTTTAAQLAAVTKLRDDDLYNEFSAMQRINRHLGLLCISMSLFLLGVGVLAAVTCAMLGKVAVLLGVMCFGALGAAVSMMILIAPQADGSLPSQLKTGTLLFARPLFGAAAAVAVYVFIRMGVIARPYADSDFTYFGLSFVAGFSDQLLLSAVNKAAKSSGDSTKKSNP